MSQIQVELNRVITTKTSLLKEEIEQSSVESPQRVFWNVHLKHSKIVLQYIFYLKYNTIERNERISFVVCQNSQKINYKLKKASVHRKKTNRLSYKRVQ